MKLCTFDDGGWSGVGRIEGDRVVVLSAPTMIEHLAHGSRDVGERPLSDLRLLAPVPQPPSIRDFYAFESHVVNARKGQGLTVPAAWYDIPVFYFSNPAAVCGPGDTVAVPTGSTQLDYELELAVVIGGDGEIFGFTVMNDWSARDLQQQEIPVGLGPAKGKDFATSLGPVIVSVDELGDGGLTMSARVNGVERSRGNSADMHFSWKQIIDRARLNTRLLPGDVIGSGTVGTGCILELGDGSWLRPGDLVELEIEGIGVLANRVGAGR